MKQTQSKWAMPKSKCVWLGSLMITCRTCNLPVALRSQVRLRAATLPGNNFRQVVHPRASVHQAVQISTGFTAGKVAAVICRGLALLPYIKQG